MKDWGKWVCLKRTIGIRVVYSTVEVAGSQPSTRAWNLGRVVKRDLGLISRLFMAIIMTQKRPALKQ